MDNNILCSPKLKEIVENIRTLGFTGEKDYIPPNPFDMMLGKIERRKKYKVDYSKQLSETVDFIKIFANRIKRFSKPLGELNEIIESINESDDKDGALVTHTKFLSEIIEKYRNKTRMIRYVDFNQGIDAKRIKKRNMKLLSTIPIRPFRLACDKIRDIDKFNIATKLAIKNNVRHFSNYILYNWKDKPEDLWTRLNNATSLYTENGNNITGYSFPMKFSPIDSTDRRYIGKHWNKKYLNAINVIINVTNGVVAKERDFFHEAFGSNIDKYFELLRMPDEFIRQRVFFKENGLIQCWKTLFHTLEKNEKAYLLHVLCKDKISESYKPDNYPKRVKKILVLYKVNKLQMEKGKKSYQSIINEIELIK